MFLTLLVVTVQSTFGYQSELYVRYSEYCIEVIRLSKRSLLNFASLMPFLLAQKYAKPWAVMTSYSRLNGLHVSENPRLLQNILRDEWKFNGLCIVSSDIWGRRIRHAPDETYFRATGTVLTRRLSLSKLA